MYQSNRNIVYFLLLTIFLISGCGGGSTNTATTNTATIKNTATPTIATTETTTPTAPSDTTEATETTEAPTSTTTPIAKAIQSGQIKDYLTGEGLANVKVSLGESTSTTDENGFYTLTNLTETTEAVVSFEKDGYLLGSTETQIKDLSKDNTQSPNYIEYDMYSQDYQYDTEENIDSSRIFVDNSKCIDSNGNVYNGITSVKLTIIDSSESAFLDVFPYAFKGININGTEVEFASYGLISVSLKDINGQILKLARGDTAILIFHVPTSERSQTIPLWYYDSEKDSWIEEGFAERQSNGTYRGEISHLGIWSMNRPIETDSGTYTDRILYPDGTPATNLRVYAIGKNWISSDLSTDENGLFEINVLPGEEFTLEVYQYVDKYAAKFSGTIPAIKSGEISSKIQ